MDTVTKQAVGLRQGLRVLSRLIEAYSPRLRAGGRVFYSYPSPERLAAASVEELRSHGLSRLKARALREIASAEIEHRLPQSRRLYAIPGVLWRSYRSYPA